MTLQNAKAAEKFMGYQAYIMVFIGIALLVSEILLVGEVFPIVTDYATIAILVLAVTLIGSFIMFCVKGGINSLTEFFEFKDEFLRATDTKAYKHSFYALLVALLFTYLWGSTVFMDASHASMALIYIAIGLIAHGLSIIWQCRA